MTAAKERARWLGATSREDAKKSAATIRAALVDPAAAGERGLIHIDMARPRRGIWLTTWRNIPGLTLDRSTNTYAHALLPGWLYTPAEMRCELIVDLEHFADTGNQPKEVTR